MWRSGWFIEDGAPLILPYFLGVHRITSILTSASVTVHQGVQNSLRDRNHPDTEYSKDCSSRQSDVWTFRIV